MIKFIIALFLLIPFTCDAGLIMRGTAALRVWDEKFEAIGYDESWSEGETIVGTGGLDEDQASSSAGSPSGWGGKCLKVVSGPTDSDLAYVHHIFSPALGGSLYFRIEFVVESQTSDRARLLSATDSSGNQVFTVFLDISPDFIVMLTINNDGLDNTFSVNSPTLSLNTRYRVEVKYDITNDLWELKLDGVSKLSGALTGAHPTDIANIYLGDSSTTTGISTIYHDLFAIDDADWVGAE